MRGGVAQRYCAALLRRDITRCSLVVRKQTGVDTFCCRVSHHAKKTCLHSQTQLVYSLEHMHLRLPFSHVHRCD